MPASTMTNQMKTPKAGETKKLIRLLKLLNGSASQPVGYVRSGRNAELTRNGKLHVFPLDLVLGQFSNGAVRRTMDGLVITKTGQRKLTELIDVSASLENSNAEEKSGNQVLGNKPDVNLNESPLMRLFMRGNSAKGFKLTGEEFAAGERLRSDFERGRLQPRITANWQANVGGRGRSVNEGAELSDFALDCRNRVEKAISALGPELSGVCLDVCCFLKGLQAVELERRWPARSAKLMLKTGLGILARHYGILASSPNMADGGRIEVWKTEDAKPAMLGRDIAR